MPADRQRESEAEDIDTVVIGAGQSGLSASYWLTKAGHAHVVLEASRIGSSWLDKRWDSFTLVTPNWMNRLPGFPYDGPEPDGFLARDEIVAYLESYARSFGAPVRTGVKVQRLAALSDGKGYLVKTSAGDLTARNVVVTVGYFHKPKLPGFAAKISPQIEQLSSSQYRNPAALRPGAVLVVGSGQSGSQIAEELHDAGRQVFLCVSRAPREARRYRGRDINYWDSRMGGFERGFRDPANPVERYRANPHSSGKNGGHAINLRDFAARGITLLGRLADAAGDRITTTEDVEANLAAADKASRDHRQAIDDYIATSGLHAPLPDRFNTDDGESDGGPAVRTIPELCLSEHGIATIIWATGFTGDYGWIDLPVLDERGYPRQDHGVTPHPGLYFCGLHWMYSLGSGLFYGVGEAARQVTDHLLAREKRNAA